MRGAEALTVVYKFARRNKFALPVLCSLPLAVRYLVTLVSAFRCTRLIRHVIMRWFVFVYRKILLSSGCLWTSKIRDFLGN